MNSFHNYFKSQDEYVYRVQKDFGHLLDNINDESVAILWGIKCNAKANTLFREKISGSYKNFITCELGYFNRRNYFSLSINGINGSKQYVGSLNLSNGPNMKRVNQSNPGTEAMNRISESKKDSTRVVELGFSYLLSVY